MPSCPRANHHHQMLLRFTFASRSRRPFPHPRTPSPCTDGYRLPPAAQSAYRLLLCSGFVLTIYKGGCVIYSTQKSAQSNSHNTTARACDSRCLSLGRTPPTPPQQLLHTTAPASRSHTYTVARRHVRRVRRASSSQLAVGSICGVCVCCAGVYFVLAYL